eukprot:14055901-Ditylum_brightwellii.AAC.1
MEDWQKRNIGMWCAFDGSGCGIILLEREYADRRMNQNRKFFSNMSFASSRKMTYDLERQHEDNENGESLNILFCNAWVIGPGGTSKS